MGMGSGRSKSHRSSPEGHPGPTSLYHSDSIDPDNEGLDARASEEPSVILVGDACLTALTTLDLRSLSPEWDRGITQAVDSGSGCGSDLEDLLGVTFSGGEDSLVSVSACYNLSSVSYCLLSHPPRNQFRPLCYGQHIMLFCYTSNFVPI